MSHVYVPGPQEIGPLGERVCAVCELPAANRAHQVPDTSEEMEESRRRAGERD